MGRIGISEFQVFQAADQLIAEGLQPSVDTVRVELGNTGSRSTINKYLKLWRERRNHRDAAGANLSGHLKQVITEQAELLLSALEAESSLKLQVKMKEFEDANQSLQDRYQQLEQASLRSIESLKVLQELADNQALQLLQRQSEITDLLDQNQTQREALAKEIGRREAMESAIHERDRQLAMLQKEFKSALSRNEILNEALATKTSNLQQWQEKEHAQRTAIKEKNNEIKQLTRELTALRAQKDKDIAHLSRSLTKLLSHQSVAVKARRNPTLKKAGKHN